MGVGFFPAILDPRISTARPMLRLAHPLLLAGAYHRNVKTLNCRSLETDFFGRIPCFRLAHCKGA